MSAYEFDVSWDGVVRDRGLATIGVPPGSSLSLVLLLVYMAPILEGIEK